MGGIILFILCHMGLVAYAANYKVGEYSIDPEHSRIGITVPHLGVSRIEGKFKNFEGSISLKSSFSKSILKASMEVNSLTTEAIQRDERLKSTDFFDVLNFPKIVFESKFFQGTPERFTIFGELTIKDVTKSVPIVGKYIGSVKNASGDFQAVFSGSTSVNRKEFKLNDNDLVDTVSLVGDEVEIDLVIEATRK